jgi:hypothetical protein
VKLPDGVESNKWGWIGVEEVNPQNNNSFVDWAGGFGLNDTGTASITLAAGKRYRVFANPSSGSVGAQTSCYIDTNGSIAITKTANLCTSGDLQAGTNNLTITLSSGNVGGVVTYLGNPVANATVYASVVGALNDDESVFAATTTAGRFGFQLDFANGTKQWVIKVFPFNDPAVPTKLANQTLATLSDQNANLTISLAAKP